MVTLFFLLKYGLVDPFQQHFEVEVYCFRTINYAAIEFHVTLGGIVAI